MAAEIEIELTCKGAEWEIDEMLNLIGSNVAAKEWWHNGHLTRDAPEEPSTFQAFFEVHKLFPFLKAALPTEAFRAALFEGCEYHFKDLGVEIESVEVR